VIEVLEITAQCASDPQRVDDPARSGPSEATEARDQGLLLSDVGARRECRGVDSRAPRGRLSWDHRHFVTNDNVKPRGPLSCGPPEIA